VDLNELLLLMSGKQRQQKDMPPYAKYIEKAYSPERYSGMIEPGNIDLFSRPRVKNPDGSISTVRSIGIEMDGNHYLIPTVSDEGKLLSNKDAIDLFKKTKRHLGVFENEKSSSEYAKQLHNQQANLYRE